MNLEDLRLGAAVHSRDGRKLGSLSRFVVKTDGFRLTHIVIDTGILRSGEPLWKGGWGLSHDRVVPLGVLEHAGENDVRLTMSADEFRDLSVDYIEEHFERIPDDAPGRLDASDMARVAASIPGEPGPYFMTETMATGAGEVDIKRDSPVWRLRPHEKIGEVERLLVDQETSRVVDMIVRRGHVFAKDVVLPVRHVVEVVADIVRIDIDDATLDALPEFKPEGAED